MHLYGPLYLVFSNITLNTDIQRFPLPIGPFHDPTTLPGPYYPVLGPFYPRSRGLLQQYDIYAV